mmetsp:Transcript_69613/g.193735  ORF Transcript_69613/g.193735 Transcript_69613/m.193735 type:complete len:87 (+) Transcript_69613:3005-3265(+)
MHRFDVLLYRGRVLVFSPVEVLLHDVRNWQQLRVRVWETSHATAHASTGASSTYYAGATAPQPYEAAQEFADKAPPQPGASTSIAL